MNVNGCAYLTICLPNTFNLLSLSSHSVCFILNNVRQKTKFRVLVPMLIKVQICRLLERIRSVFSHIVRRDTLNLPKPSPPSNAAKPTTQRQPKDPNSAPTATPSSEPTYKPSIKPPIELPTRGPITEGADQPIMHHDHHTHGTLHPHP